MATPLPHDGFPRVGPPAFAHVVPSYADKGSPDVLVVHEAAGGDYYPCPDYLRSDQAHLVDLQGVLGQSHLSDDDAERQVVNCLMHAWVRRHPSVDMTVSDFGRAVSSLLGNNTKRYGLDFRVAARARREFDALKKKMVETKQDDSRQRFLSRQDVLLQQFVLLFGELA